MFVNSSFVCLLAIKVEWFDQRRLSFFQINNSLWILVGETKAVSFVEINESLTIIFNIRCDSDVFERIWNDFTNETTIMSTTLRKFEYWDIRRMESNTDSEIFNIFKYLGGRIFVFKGFKIIFKLDMNIKSWNKTWLFQMRHSEKRNASFRNHLPKTY